MRTGVALCCVLVVLTGVSASKSHTRSRNALAAAPATVAQTSAPGAATTYKITYDHYSLIDGKRSYIWSGEFQYWPVPSPGLWRVFRSNWLGGPH